MIYNIMAGWSPLKNMNSTVGMMTFPTEWKNKKNVPNHQPESPTKMMV
jgi:hypothetical protein